MILNSGEEVTTDEHSLTLMKKIQTGGIELSVHLPGERHPSQTSACISVISENQWFNCVC